MIDQKIKLITGSLLHDIGKVVYREGSDRRNHSVSGYDFLKEEGKIEDKEILDCVRYHHFSEIKSARLKEDNLAYIVYGASLRDDRCQCCERIWSRHRAESGK